MRFSRKRGTKEDEKERKVTLLRGGNPSARPLLIRIYGTLGCLAITCFFIGLMVFLEKTLPDGSKSQFHPTWKRDLSAKPRRQVPTVPFANVTKVSASTVAEFTTVIVLTVDTIRRNPSIARGSCFSTQVDCTTVDVPGRLRARYQAVQCSTQIFPCSATINGLFTTSPPAVSPSPSINSCIISVVDCSESPCLTQYQTLSSCGPSSSPPRITSPPVISSPPASTGPVKSVNPCVTSLVYCTDSECFTNYETLSPCGGTTSSIPPIITAPPISQSPSPSSTVDQCIVSFVYCVSEECFTVTSTRESCFPTSSSPPPSPTPTSSIDPCVTAVRSCIETDCFTVFSTQASCLTTISKPPSITPTSSTDPCVTGIRSCIGTDCFTVFSTQASCLTTISSPPSITPTSSTDPCVVTFTVCSSERCDTYTTIEASCLSPSSLPPSITPTSSVDPCITSSYSCDLEDCFVVKSTQASCLTASSPPASITPNSSVGPCLYSTVSCVETGCFTITSTAASCLPTSNPPVSSPVPTSSIDPCLATTVSCNEEESCVTITSTQASCLPISSPPISSPTPTSSVDPCITSTVSCPVLGRGDKRQEETDCTTSYFTAASCLPSFSPSIITPTPNSSVSFSPTPTLSISSSNSSAVFTPTPTISPSSLPPCITSTVSCPDNIFKRQQQTDCVTSFFSISKCRLTSTSSSPSPTITPTISLPSCVSSTVRCTTTSKSIGKRHKRVHCITSFFTICATSTSSNSSFTTPTPTISINSCFTPELVCPTPTATPRIALAIARIGGFFPDVTGFPVVSNECVTTYVSISGCGVIITSNSSSSSIPPPTSISSPSSSTSPVSVLMNSSSSISITSSIRSSTTSSPPILVITPPTSTSSSVPVPTSPSRVIVVTPSSSSSSPIISTSSTPVPVVTPSTKSSSTITIIVPSTSPSVSIMSPISILSSSRTSSTPLPILILTPPTSFSLIPTPISSVSSSFNTSPSLIILIIPTSSRTSTVPLSLTTPLSVSPVSSSSSSASPLSFTLTVSTSPTINTVASLPSTSTTPVVPASSISSPTNTLLSTPFAITTPSASNTIPLVLFTSPLSSPPFVSPQVTSSFLSFASTFTDSFTPSRTAHLVTSASVSEPHPASLESQQASMSGTLPPGVHITPLPSGTGGGGGGGSTNTSDNPSDSRLDMFPTNKVVVGNYVPIIVGRAFVQFLTPFYNTILLHEPIRQLTNPGGAPFSTLAGSPTISIPITGVLLLAHLGSGFAAGATFLDTSYCTQPPCPPRLSSNPWVMNFIISILIIQAITILIMIFHWWKKPNSLRADPTSIAGVAVVMGHPMIEQEFSDVPAEFTVADLKRMLKGRRYKLGTFQTASGITKYGIMPVPPSELAQRKERKPGFLTKLGAMKEKIPFINDWRNNRFYFDTVFAMLLIALLALTCAALSHARNSRIVFLATAAASGTGLRIFLAVLGTIVSWYWGRLFRDMQSFTPYIDLGRGDAEADPTILLRKHMFPITAFFPLLWKGHFTAASVAFTGLTAEFLIIALAGLPYRPGQQRGEFIFWSVLSLAILTLMVAQLLIVNVWRRKLPTLTRPPATVAAVMTYVAETGMSRDFESLSMVKTEERDEAIKMLGKSYAYGWRREPSGRARWVIDEVRGKERVVFFPPTRRVDSFEAVRL